MSMDSLPSRVPTPAEDLFSEYAIRVESGESVDFEALCAAYPALAEELRGLLAHHRAQRQMRRAAGAGTLPPETSASSEQTRTILASIRARGASLDRYRIVEKIGAGGMGTVYEAEDKLLGRRVALKVISDKARAAEFLPLFDREMRIAARLTHPGVGGAFDAGVDEAGRVFFTMPLVRGRDLSEILELVRRQAEGWTVIRAVGVVRQVCETMAYVHSRGVIHRDLKPSNIRVGEFGEVLVLDWGLAKDLTEREGAEGCAEAVASSDSDFGSQSRSGSGRGTPAYMSPEQAGVGNAPIGPATDVYAVGAMLYEILAGQPPYSAEGERAQGAILMERIYKGPPRRLESISNRLPGELVLITEKAMAREVRDRYPNLEALASDLNAYLENRVTTFETGTWAETKKWVRRNRALAGSLAATFVVLILGVITSLLYAGEANAARTDLTAKNAELADAKAVAEQRAEEAQAQSRRADGEAAKARGSAETARLAAEESARQEALATATLEDLLSLSAIQDLKELEARAEALWPAHTENVPKYDAWLADARLLIEGQAEDKLKGVKKRASLLDHEAKLAEIRKRSKPLTPEQIEEDRRESPSYTEWEKARKELKVATGEAARTLEARVSELQASVEERRTWDFEDSEDRWWHAQLSKLVSDLKSFTDENAGGLFWSGTSEKHGWGIVKRAEFARTIEERSVSGAEARRRWEEAIASIASSPKYGGLVMTPQIGLLPIGADPTSGLWEFWHLQSGSEPSRGADEKLVLKDEMGLVFVLIPAGTFMLGAQEQNASESNYDPQAARDETPYEVTLDAYFLSKYELTQGQWEYLTGRNPSQYGPCTYETSWNRYGTPWSALHPVEQVTWHECARLLARIGLVLPTEAQWEHGCRGSTSSVYWSGDDPTTLADVGNLADQFAKANAGVSWLNCESWDDGNVAHAAVGSYRANELGLHDMHGNVFEWCRDGYGKEQIFAVGDGERQVSGAPYRAVRGGSFSDAALDARSAYRYNLTPESQGNNLGLRPARASLLSASTPLPPGK